MPDFILSKKTYEFSNPSTGELYRIPSQYMGTVPDWVSKTWLFQAAVKETSITFVGNRQPESVPEPPPESVEPITPELPPDSPAQEESKSRKKA